MLVVIGAMDEEVRLIKSRMTKKRESVHAQINVVTGKFKGVEIALAQSGVGKVNATICTCPIERSVTCHFKNSLRVARIKTQIERV